MSKTLGIVGFSGSGKSASLRNMPAKETFIISPSKADLPIPGFETKYKTVDKAGENGNFYMTKDLKKMSALVKKVATSEHYKHIKYLVIEDNTHFFNAMTLSSNFRSQNTGNAAWARWGDFGAEVYQALFGHEGYREDLWIITMFHPESYMTPSGEKLKIKTPGNLLDREVDIPSYYTNLLYTKVEPVDRTNPQPAKERYKFVTNDDGYMPAKTVLGAFEELYIDNDLYTVITRLKEIAKQK
jgi:hypothetical protein